MIGQIPWLLWCAQCWAGLCGGDNVSGSLGPTWPRSCRAWGSEAPRPLLPVQPGSSRRSRQTHCMAFPKDWRAVLLGLSPSSFPIISALSIPVTGLCTLGLASRRWGNEPDSADVLHPENLLTVVQMVQGLFFSYCKWPHLPPRVRSRF